MNSENKLALLNLLAEVWSLSPDVRLGQLMAMMGEIGSDRVNQGLWTIEDDDLAAILMNHRSDLLARLPYAGVHFPPAASNVATPPTASRHP